MSREPTPTPISAASSTSVKTIALVGASANSARPSYIVLKYLSSAAIAMLPINPGLAGKPILGAWPTPRSPRRPARSTWSRSSAASEYAGGIVDEALALDPLPRVIWMQLGVRDDAAAGARGREGVKVVMNRCPKIE